LQKTFKSLFNLIMKTMETKRNQNQIVIKTDAENEKQNLPVNLLISLVAGVIAGVALIFGLFWGAELLLGM